MTGQRKIYVDFNNRIRPKASKGEFFRVGLDEITGLELLERVVATDHDELEFEVIVVARRNDLGYGIVQLDRSPLKADSTPKDAPKSDYRSWGVDSEVDGTEIGPQELIYS